MPANFLSLPLELRQLIYEELFSTYVIKHGFNPPSRVPSPAHRGAILQTCKQIHVEARDFLPKCATFQFQGTEAMLETLLGMDQAIVTRIRHVRVVSYPFPLYTSGKREFYNTYFFQNALSLFPGLELERLIVEDAYHGFALVDGWRDVVTYFDIEALLGSNGWKELVYITPTTDFITSGYDHKRQRRTQPENWNAMLQKCDGEASGAQVQMFIKPASGRLGVNRVSALQPWSATPGNKVIDGSQQAGPGQYVKGEVTIIARRGRKASYRQTGIAQHMSWDELKNKEGGFHRKGEPPSYNTCADIYPNSHGRCGTTVVCLYLAYGH
jgi:hypothetical protein